MAIFKNAVDRRGVRGVVGDDAVRMLKKGRCRARQGFCSGQVKVPDRPFWPVTVSAKMFDAP